MNPQPKERPVRSEPYRRLVASLPCFECYASPPSQAAHADMGKGMGIKSSDLTCFPLCPKCHRLYGSSGWLTKEGRREMEKIGEIATQLKLIELSQDDHKVRKLLVKLGLVK